MQCDAFRKSKRQRDFATGSRCRRYAAPSCGLPTNFPLEWETENAGPLSFQAILPTFLPPLPRLRGMEPPSPSESVQPLGRQGGTKPQPAGRSPAPTPGAFLLPRSEARKDAMWSSVHRASSTPSPITISADGGSLKPLTSIARSNGRSKRWQYRAYGLVSSNPTQAANLSPSAGLLRECHARLADTD